MSSVKSPCGTHWCAVVCGSVVKRGPILSQACQAALGFAAVLELLPLPSHSIAPHLDPTCLSLTLDLTFPGHCALWISRAWKILISRVS